MPNCVHKHANIYNAGMIFLHIHEKLRLLNYSHVKDANEGFNVIQTDFHKLCPNGNIQQVLYALQ
jgi:hypothetical protein